MTLNVTVITQALIAQSSDLRLTNPDTGAIVDDASPKQVAVSYFGWRAVIGYSGPAVLNRLATHVWLAELLADLPKDPEPKLSDVVEMIRTHGSSALSNVRYRRFSLVIVAYAGVSPRLYLVSNYQRLNGADLPNPLDHLFTTGDQSGKPRIAIAGAQGAIGRHDRRALLRLLHGGLTDQEVINEMARFNIRAAEHGRGRISTQCVVHVLRPGGTASSAVRGQVRRTFLPRQLQMGNDLAKMLVDHVEAGTIPGPLVPTNILELTTPEDGWELGAALSLPRMAQTTTLMATGEMLVVGGRNGSVAYSQTETYDSGKSAWMSAGNLSYSRHGHQAVLLTDGRVLVTGGLGDNSRSCELFDPATRIWAVTASMHEGRYSHRACLLANGYVLVSGGIGEGRQLATTEVFDPASEKWYQVANMSLSRQDHISALLPDRTVLVAGGTSQERGGEVSDCEIFDPQAEGWRDASAMSIVRSRHAVVELLDGRVLVVGARGYRRAEVYDVTRGIWNQTAEMTIERHSGLAAVRMADGRVLVSGGQGPGDALLATTEQYDPDHDEWMFFGTASVGRAMHDLVRLSSGQVASVAGAVNFADAPSGVMTLVQTASAVSPRPTHRKR